MEKVVIAPFNIIGIAVQTSNINGRAAEDIPKLWNQFMEAQIINKIPNKMDTTIYSLYTDYEGDHTMPYTTLLGCKVNNLDTIPNGMIGKSFKGGNYIKITAKGNLNKGLVIGEWQKIWQMDLERKYTVDFEIYGEKAANPADAEVAILISVE